LFNFPCFFGRKKGKAVAGTSKGGGHDTSMAYFLGKHDDNERIRTFFLWRFWILAALHDGDIFPSVDASRELNRPGLDWTGGRDGMVLAFVEGQYTQ